MTDESVFVFKLVDEGDAPPPAPGAAARGSAEPAARPAPREPDAGKPSKPPKQPDKPEGFEKPLIDAIKKASEFSTLRAFAGSGALLLAPLLDLARLASAFRRSPEKAQPGKAAASRDPIPVARPVVPGQQTFSLSRALFQAQGAQILIVGGNVKLPDGRPIVPQRAADEQRRTPPLIPSQPPARPSRAPGGLPALPPPRPSLPVPIAPRTAAGAAARAAIPAGGAAAGGAAGGIASLGAALASAAVPIVGMAIAAGAAAAALRGLHNRATQQAKELAAFNATLAAAQARAQVANIRQDISSARFLGKDLARLTDAQTKLGVSATRILNLLEKAGLQAFLPLLEVLAGAADKATEFAEENGDFVQVGIESALRGIGFGALVDAAKIVGFFSKKGDQRKALEQGDFHAIFEAFEKLDIDSDEGQPGAPGGPRPPIQAPGLGPLPLP